jgi:NAD(P)-dependent dehydrogenase (short-subunit alcohol dehydrogenase family)
MDDVAQGAQPAELDGKVALVTGSSSGIGEACVRRLAALGCRVIVNSMRRSKGSVGWTFW